MIQPSILPPSSLIGDFCLEEQFVKCECKYFSSPEHNPCEEERCRVFLIYHFQTNCCLIKLKAGKIWWTFLQDKKTYLWIAEMFPEGIVWKKREQRALGQQTGLSVCCISRCHPILESRDKSHTKKIHVVHRAMLPSWAARGGHSGELGCGSDCPGGLCHFPERMVPLEDAFASGDRKTPATWARRGSPRHEAQASVLTQISLCNEEMCSHLKGGCPRVEGILVMSSSGIM